MKSGNGCGNSHLAASYISFTVNDPGSGMSVAKVGSRRREEEGLENKNKR